MSSPVTKLDRALKLAGVMVAGVSPIPGGGYQVYPEDLQATAQPIIDAFDPDDPAHEQAELDTQVKAALDTERMFSALVWAILDTYSAPATLTKYQAARTKIVTAYKSQPWKV